MSQDWQQVKLTELCEDDYVYIRYNKGGTKGIVVFCNEEIVVIDSESFGKWAMWKSEITYIERKR